MDDVFLVGAVRYINFNLLISFACLNVFFLAIQHEGRLISCQSLVASTRLRFSIYANKTPICLSSLCLC